MSQQIRERMSIAETLQQRQSELEHFIANSRRQLKSLSESLADARRTPVTLDQCESVVAADPAEAADDSCVEAQPPTVAQTSTNTPHEGADPLERLNAIKLRLAQQIENA